MSEKESKESQYIVSHPGLGSNPLFRSNRDLGVTNGLVTCMSYANCSSVGILSNTCSMHTYK